MIAKSSSSKKAFQNNLEIKAKNALIPLIQASHTLLTDFGFTEEELISEFGSLESPEILYMSFAIIGFSKQATSNNET